MTGRDHPMAPVRSIGQRPSRPRTAGALIHGGSTAALLIALMGIPLGADPKAEGIAAATSAPPSLGSAPGAQMTPGLVPEDIAALLPLLMTSPERRHFAAELEAAIRLGRLEEAERQLKVAIETGTLAILLSDRLQEPSLLAALQTIDLKPEAEAAAKDPGVGNAPDANCSVAAIQPGPDISELQAALEQEKAQSNAALKELSGVSEELTKTQQAREAEAASAAAAIAKSRELETALQQEREGNDARRQDLELELTNLRKDFEALQAQRDRAEGDHASVVADAQAALTRERERSQAAAHELAVLKDEIGSLKAARDSDADATSKISDLEESLRRERERADAAMNDLAAARKEASDRQALAAREAAADLASLSGALAQERSRTDAVTRQLADATDALQAAQEAHMSGPAPLLFRLAADAAPLPVGGGTRAETEPPPPAQPFQVAAAGMASGFDQPAPALPSPADRVASLPGSSPKAGPDTITPQTGIAPAAPAATEDRLVRRADALIQSGDVSGARLLLERSMEAGNAQAAFRLAETFDPNVLSRLGAFGIRPDPARARDLYARALALGIRQAGERMQALK